MRTSTGALAAMGSVLRFQLWWQQRCSSPSSWIRGCPVPSGAPRSSARQGRAGTQRDRGVSAGERRPCCGHQGIGTQVARVAEGEATPLARCQAKLLTLGLGPLCLLATLAPGGSSHWGGGLRRPWVGRPQAELSDAVLQQSRRCRCLTRVQSHLPRSRSTLHATTLMGFVPSTVSEMAGSIRRRKPSTTGQYQTQFF